MSEEKKESWSTAEHMKEDLEKLEKILNEPNPLNRLFEFHFEPLYTIAAHPEVIKNLKKTKWWKLFKKS